MSAAVDLLIDNRILSNKPHFMWWSARASASVARARVVVQEEHQTQTTMYVHVNER